MEVNFKNDTTAYTFSADELEEIGKCLSTPLVLAYFSTMRNQILRLRLGVDLLDADAASKIIAEDAYCKGQNDLLLRLTPENIINVL